MKHVKREILDSSSIIGGGGLIRTKIRHVFVNYL